MGDVQQPGVGTTVLRSALMAGVALAILSGMAHHKYGGVRQLVAAMQGGKLLAEEPKLRIRTKIGEDSVVKFSLINCFDRPIQITGCKVSCDCMSTEKMPKSIPPFQRASFAVTIGSSTDAKPFQRSIILFASEREQPSLLLSVAANQTE